MSYCCHSFDSYVVKTASGESGGNDPTVIPFHDINLIYSLARTVDSQKILHAVYN